MFSSGLFMFAGRFRAAQLVKESFDKNFPGFFVSCINESVPEDIHNITEHNLYINLLNKALVKLQKTDPESLKIRDHLYAVLGRVHCSLAVLEKNQVKSLQAAESARLAFSRIVVPQNISRSDSALVAIFLRHTDVKSMLASVLLFAHRGAKVSTQAKVELNRLSVGNNYKKPISENAAKSVKIFDTVDHQKAFEDKLEELSEPSPAELERADAKWCSSKDVKPRVQIFFQHIELKSVKNASQPAAGPLLSVVVPAPGALDYKYR